jgi:hypothetical protein
MPELQPKKTSNEKEGKKAEGKFKKRDEKERAKDGGKRAEKKGLKRYYIISLT